MTQLRRLSQWRELAPVDRGAALALGNFDGVHQGHQAVLQQTQALASRLGAPLGVMVFRPHPRAFFRPADPPFRLMSDDARAQALVALGVELLYETPFDRDLSLMDAEAFCREVLAEGVGPAAVVTGFDYRFGKDRGGDVESLAAAGARFGFTVEATPQWSVGGVKCSSSAIRHALRAGDVAAAEQMLTRPWCVDGVVSRGDQRGRLLGFPTANVSLGDLVRPRFGVYAVEVRVEGEELWRPGVANIGARPTVSGQDERLEAHVFDFSGDLYGRRVEVRIRAFLRDERKFDGLDALKAQIAQDADQARAVLA